MKDLLMSLKNVYTYYIKDFQNELKNMVVSDLNKVSGQ